MILQLIMRVAVCAALVALCVAGAELFSTQPVAGREAEPVALQGAAALDRLKRDGQYDSLLAAMNQARFGVSRAKNTPLGRAAWHAPNPAAGYDAYVTEEATYSLTIDPLFMLQQKLTVADGAYFDHFGGAVALSDDTLVVGSPFNDTGANTSQGSVYVFTRSGSTWTQQQKLTASDGAAGDFFGGSVALDGDTLAVGADGDTIGGNTSQGSAYVFTRSGLTWTQQQKLIANDGEHGNHFGGSVALDGDTVVVGAQYDNIGANLNQGSAYVYARSGLTWTQQQKLIANDGEASDHFGDAVALDGDNLLVGAAADKIGGNTSQGSVYVYTRSGLTWTQQQKLIANDGAASDFFGQSVALDGDTLAVGAYRDSISGNTTTAHGSAYVFTRGGAMWTQQQKLIASDGAANDQFGGSVALDGDTLLVGAPWDDIGAFVDQGSAYVFTRSGAIWTQQQKLTANDGEDGDRFGNAVALDGDTLVAGAMMDDIGANSLQGSVYVFFMPPCPTLTFAPASLPNGIGLAPYQQSVTVSGGAGPYQFALSSGSLPPGISLTSSGLLSGTPTTLGSYKFLISATDLSSGCSGSGAYDLTITSCPSITIMPHDLPEGARGEAYNETLEATGGGAPYSFSLAKTSALPRGLRLSQHGVLSGTPTTWGVFDFTVHVRDANGCAGSQDYTLNVAFAGEGGEVETGLLQSRFSGDFLDESH